MKVSRRSFVAGAAASAATAVVGPERLHALRALPEERRATLHAADWQQQGVLDLRRSRYAKMRNVPVHAVRLQGGFWEERRKVTVGASLPSMHELLEQHGRMSNFRRLVGKSSGPQVGKYYSDSDVYKWTEAASWAQQSGSPELFKAQVEEITALVQGVQEPSGYLNTYYVGDRAPLRMLPETQQVGHELYNIGHLIQGAIAQYRATGDTRLLRCCVRFVDGFLIPGYGPEASKKPIVSGHPEIEMALVELYRLTGERRYLELAGYILNGDKRIPLPADQSVYLYCGVPFTSRVRLEGHAVRAMYACCGATDYYLETGDERYLKTLGTLWQDLVQDQMYVSGGVGARRKHEAFGDPYELPNLTAYGESCAAIGNMMWNWRMLHATGDSRHADVMERALYNGINSGMSLSGTMYCYRNPLAYDPASAPIRNPWYDTTCCPPNLQRTFASLPGYMYSTASDGLYVHLFHSSVMDWHLEDGTPIRVEQATEYPWDGRITMTLAPAHPAEFTVHVRIPGWARGAKVEVGGVPAADGVPGRYLALTRVWHPGDSIVLDLPMGVQMLVADARVAEDQGRVAVQRGPLLYCAEDVDQAQKVPVRNLRLDLGQADSAFVVKRDAGLLGGVDVLEHRGKQLSVAGAAGELYAPIAPQDSSATQVRMVPYYAWANRGASGMEVWMPVQQG